MLHASGLILCKPSWHAGYLPRVSDRNRSRRLKRTLVTLQTRRPYTRVYNTRMNNCKLFRYNTFRYFAIVENPRGGGEETAPKSHVKRGKDSERGDRRGGWPQKGARGANTKAEKESFHHEDTKARRTSLIPSSGRYQGELDAVKAVRGGRIAARRRKGRKHEECEGNQRSTFNTQRSTLKGAGNRGGFNTALVGCGGGSARGGW
jgi:hypothetical protein